MGSFLKLLTALAPLVVASPWDHSLRRWDTSACTSASTSDSFSWPIDNLTYHLSEIYTTPAHLVASATLDFKIGNPALPSSPVVHCYAYSSAYSLYFYGQITYACDDVSLAGSATKTYFTVSLINDELTVNQTWTCPQDAYTATFKGYGSTILPLDCHTTYYVNPNYTSPSSGFYSTRTTTCVPLTFTLTPSEKEVA
ncbi:hypothetical protein F5Y17DRAFT_459469 [Xylariaceae sp. FL0594]|nr:hypothetical protein F5Y17DRAFT_459469 [Xylariaceae sp. FL0594]